MLVASKVGHEISMTALSVVTAGGLLLTGRRRESLRMLVGVGGGLVLAHVLPRIFQRQRPPASYRIPMPTTFSFPSGHITVSTAVLATLLVVLHRADAPLTLRAGTSVFVACVVPTLAVSRVYLGVHYPSDVVAAHLASAAWVSGCAALP